MAEYIEKQAAIKELCETYEHEYPTASGAFDEYATRIVPNVLRNLPPADVRPVVRAVWQFEEHGPEDYEQFWRCPVCAEKTYFITNYCPNCGADMRGGDAE